MKITLASPIRQMLGGHLGNVLTYRLLLGAGRQAEPTGRESLRRCMDWLLVAHHAVGGRGFGAEFSLSSGWGPPYPETSGYIIPTLLRASALDYRSEELREAADRTGRWLLEIQLPDGSYDAPSTRERMVFDTGQILFGLLALAGAGADGGGSYLPAARRAGGWLVANQDPAGFWLNHAYNGIPHTYYARVSWALCVLGVRTGDERFIEAARRQLAWVVAQQDPDGWFRNCSFVADGRPVLHVIAYTIRGLWESSVLLNDAPLESAATRAAEALCRLEAGRGWLESHFGPGWSPSGTSVCLTGLCQIAGIWLRMNRRRGRQDFAEAAGRCLAYARRRQMRMPGRPEADGALAGSDPLWGEYFPWSFPNWGVKFLADALLLAQGDEGADELPG